VDSEYWDQGKSIQGVFTELGYAGSDFIRRKLSKEMALATAPPLPKSFEDAARHQLAVEEELERACDSSHFRSSKRSCEFLQYIVRVTLDGRMDSLKERSIGIDLFGRDASYEPSSDATVRVRANEVRKRLSSYYASSPDGHEIRIHLPTGSYVPRFLPGVNAPLIRQQALTPIIQTIVAGAALEECTPLAGENAGNSVPRIAGITLMRPALIALLVCTLLLRHELENRGDSLRFWDRLLTGRTAMVIAVSPADGLNLASSLYPLVWVAGRYGVDARLQSDSLAGVRPEELAAVQVSSATPAALSGDKRLRWTMISEIAGSGQSVKGPLIDRQLGAGRDLSSAAVLTILPEQAGTIHVQGTDSETIRKMLEQLNSETQFPRDFVDRLDNRHVFQMLLYRDATEQWRTEIYMGGS
jgi:hypothetical protein